MKEKLESKEGLKFRGNHQRPEEKLEKEAGVCEEASVVCNIWQVWVEDDEVEE